MEIVIYRRQRVDYGEQSDTTCVAPKFACCIAGPSEFLIQRFSIERSRTVSPGGVLQRATLAADSPMEIWWTVSLNSCDVKNTKFNQYLPLLLTSLNVWGSRFRKLVMFWMWRHHDMALWRHGGGAWHNGLILTTASKQGWGEYQIYEYEYL